MRMRNSDTLNLWTQNPASQNGLIVILLFYNLLNYFLDILYLDHIIRYFQYNLYYDKNSYGKSYSIKDIALSLKS